MTWQTFDSAGALITKPGLPSYVTSLPSTPADGTEVYYAADATNGVIWHLRYRSSSSSSYKWEFIGGPPLNAQDWNSRTTTSTTLTDLTGQPSITVPLAGDYLAFHRFYGNNSNAANFAVGMIVNNTTDEAEASTASATAGNNQQPSVEKRITVTTANHVVKVRNRVAPGGTGQFIDRYLSLLPVRVG